MFVNAVPPSLRYLIYAILISTWLFVLLLVVGWGVFISSSINLKATFANLFYVLGWIVLFFLFWHRKDIVHVSRQLRLTYLTIFLVCIAVLHGVLMLGTSLVLPDIEGMLDQTLTGDGYSPVYQQLSETAWVVVMLVLLAALTRGKWVLTGISTIVLLTASSYFALFFYVTLYAPGYAISIDRPVLAEKAAAPPNEGAQPGDAFQDCQACPVMVIVPAGSFTMGSPQEEVGRDPDEGPQITVTIPKAFAVGRFEVTFDEWDVCVRAGGCADTGPRPAGRDNGWGRGQRPVLNVSWEDAQLYVAWLSRETGATYRLLSEAEWEYTARASTTSVYSWGDQSSHAHANFRPLFCCFDFESIKYFAVNVVSSKDQWVNTAPVGSFPANGFGLHDMHGNVSEWTQDCWDDSYNTADGSGAARTGGDCSLRVVRGGSWFSRPGGLRSANRFKKKAKIRDWFFGFRVARTLD